MNWLKEIFSHVVRALSTEKQEPSTHELRPGLRVSTVFGREDR